MNKIKDFLKQNIFLISTIILFMFIELFGITYTGCFPFLTKPFYPLLILSFIILLGTLFKSEKKRLIYYSILLIIQVILNTGFIYLFDSNGTVFEWAMFHQRNDAYGTVESYDFRISYIFICSIFILSYFLFYFKRNKNIKYKNQLKKKLIFIILIFFTIIGIPITENLIYNNEAYTKKIYDTNSSNYQTIGIVGNAFFELIKGNEQIKLDNLDEIDDFIYEDIIYKSKYNGISKNNNLIIILVESMEWYPFDLFKEYQNILFPNLTNFLENSIVGNNFYQKEKTDVSEALAVLGNYPTGRYINYDFYKNEYPFSLPNLIKHDNKNTIVNSFHANYGDFYNRYQLHQNFGFEQLYAIKEMKKYGVVDTWNHKKGDRNLDSIAFDKMKEVMFSKDNKFFSYILSFTMHGFYEERDNLKDYYKVIDKLEL